MAKITWNPQTMATGIPEVDIQHQEWIRRYNLFEDAMSQGKGIDVVQNTLDFFIGYAEAHFELEESVMDDRHCPAAADNHAGHEYMRDILRGYKAYVDEYGFSTSEVYALRIRMEEWLINHILTIDIQLRAVSRLRSDDLPKSYQDVSGNENSVFRVCSRPVTLILKLGRRFVR